VTVVYVSTVAHAVVQVDRSEASGYGFFGVRELPTDIISPEQPIVEAYFSNVGAFSASNSDGGGSRAGGGESRPPVV